MKVYRGSASNDFKVRNQFSRYGFPALFFTTSLELAKLYAIHQAKEERIKDGGTVYEFNIIEPSYKVNFQNAITHSRQFRNLMFDLHRKELAGAQIRDTIDYPSESMKHYISSDIIVLFDFSLILDFHPIETNVKTLLP